MNPPSFITFQNLEKYPGLLCVFSTRCGGFSSNPYDSLNLGLHTGDNQEDVNRNRNRFFSGIDIPQCHLAFTDQIHSTRAVVVDQPGVFKKTDALLSQKPGIFLSVQTADCFPIFIYDPVSKTVAVIHAGWRGTVAGIIQNSFADLTSKCGIKPKNCVVAVGPGLQAECFEVKEDVFSRIPAQFLAPHHSTEHRFLDLRGLIVDHLCACGIQIQNIYCSDLCTKCRSDLFYSYRRDGSKSGRMMGVIGLHP